MKNAKYERGKMDVLTERECAFFAYPMLNLKHVQDDSISTMDVDGQTLRYSGKFADSIPHDEIKTVICHECLHCMLLHFDRIGARDWQTWNEATDYEINGLLDNANKQFKTPVFKFPKGVLLDHKFDGKTAEEIYDILNAQKQKQPKGGQGQGQNVGGMGTVSKPPQNAPKGQGDAKDDKAGGQGQAKPEKSLGDKWKEIAITAAQIAKGKGFLPGDFSRIVGELINPPRSWREVLAEFIRELSQDDYTFKTPNIRYLDSGFFFPTLRSERLGKIAIAIDTSGSINQPILDAFMGEVEGIALDTRPEKIILLDCDARVNSVREFDATDPLPRDFSGGGGTSFIPVFDVLENEEIVCLIYFTDLYGTFPENAPNFPVIWATETKGVDVPFGQIVEIKL